LIGRELIDADEVAEFFRIDLSHGRIFIITVRLAGDDFPLYLGRSRVARPRTLAALPAMSLIPVAPFAAPPQPGVGNVITRR
jgi:hypothetical protein